VDSKDVVIIGAGPSGIATAIQLKRYGLEPMLLEKEEIGGLLRNAYLVENYPGFPEGIPGHQLVELFKRQIQNAGVEVHLEEVGELDYRDGIFFVKTDRREITSFTAVVASGTKPRRISNPNATADIEKHIFYEIHLLTQVTSEKIIVVGAGDIAFDYALNLSARGNQVIILNRGKRVKCRSLLWERAVRSEKIAYRSDTEIKSIKYQDDGVRLTCRNPTGVCELFARYLIVAIGREPALDFLSENLKKNLGKLQKASKLHLIGDVKNDVYRQTAICVGDGIRAAMKIHRNMIGEDLCE